MILVLDLFVFFAMLRRKKKKTILFLIKSIIVINCNLGTWTYNSILPHARFQEKEKFVYSFVDNLI